MLRPRGEVHDLQTWFPKEGTRDVLGQRRKHRVVRSRALQFSALRFVLFVSDHDLGLVSGRRNRAMFSDFERLSAIHMDHRERVVCTPLSILNVFAQC